MKVRPSVSAPLGVIRSETPALTERSIKRDKSSASSEVLSADQSAALAAEIVDDNRLFNEYIRYIDKCRQEPWFQTVTNVNLLDRSTFMVTDNSGKPLANTRIRITNYNNTLLAEGTTVSDGSFRYYPGIHAPAYRGKAISVEAAWGSTSKVIDLKHSDNYKNCPITLQEVIQQNNGIKVFPVAASGLNEKGTFVFRQIAFFTGAKFLFIQYGGSSAAEKSVEKTSDPGNNLDELIVNTVIDEIKTYRGEKRL